MATQIIPVVGRAYDLNPHNSATCHATMAADLPYSRPVRVVGLGDEPASPWSSVATSLTEQSGKVAQALVNKQIQKYAPDGTPQVTYFQSATSAAGKIPWLWIGIGGAVLLAGLLILRSKKQAA